MNYTKNFKILGAEAPHTMAMRDLFARSVGEFQRRFSQYVVYLDKCNLTYYDSDVIRGYMREPPLSKHVDNAFIVNVHRARYARAGTHEYVEGILGVFAALNEKFEDQRNNNRPWIAEVFAECTLNFLRDRPLKPSERNDYEKLCELVKDWEKRTAEVAFSKRTDIDPSGQLLLPYKPEPDA